MDFDRLGEIERDPLAPRQQHLFDEFEDQRMHDEALDRRRPRQQRAEALGALAVEGTLAQRRCREASAEVRLDAGDHGGLDRAPEHAPAIARQHGGVAIDRGAHAATCSATG